ncbi:zinc transporter foi [Plodia interpunctella]|uniref:zinc transporter foi n=1 Tax=Plodia interpunctella TaxID=58824 RepID=UPI002367DEB6|nr:zinc transporter foi [Plodia interpunctella]XP_053621224.1 zinc transporter foi [Plodia interpunctella]XP_053621225.1 zinc transporter foi [Plodia interpunctella]XP_053621227.1 zinc transporter foi [Plodia interpunctella]
MARHIVTVCMFCLLCAAHTCGSHIDIQTDGVLTYDPNIDVDHTNLIEEKRKLESKARYHQKLLKIRQKDRTRRDVKKPNAYYVEQIFRLYGDDSSMTMNLTGFNKMLDKLDLGKLKEARAEKNEKITHIGQTATDTEIVNCVGSEELITTVNTRLKPHDDHHEEHESETTLSQDTLKDVCPILLYHKLADNVLELNNCIVKNNLNNKHRIVTDLELSDGKNMYAVWLYSSLSIAAISACGLLGVAVIPIMHKTYYNHLLQFLVALAVGTLCGDALLHLMPHAMSPMENEATHSHDDGMWKGLAAMLGVVFFYFTEKGLTVVVEWRKRRQKLEDDKLPSRVRVLKDDNNPLGCSGSNKTANSSNSLMKIFKRDEKGDPTTKTCKHKYSEYPYCYDEIDTDTHDDHHLRDGQIPPSPKPKHNNSVSVVSSNALNAEGKEEPTAKDWLLKGEAPAVVEMNNIKHKDDNGAKDLKDDESYTVILREHSRAHHGHSHAHGHVHAPPSSMSSVAWMVIMGDGLHNFTDGMAIGAAFTSNIAGGFSTAIAVLCHELPHELGDFAVLLKAGMSVKRAVCYNVLSSALCLLGMVCGVLAGDTPSATRWLFAIAAGTFLYIALVDMMPELSTSHSKEGTLCQCILQLMGLATGIGIMLVIAMYEHDLKNLFG